jgi:hypothetical protein
VQPSRRTVLVAGALSLTAACRPRKKKTTAGLSPDVTLRSAALDRELALLAAYDAVIAKVPAAAPRLRPLAADKAAHVAALGKGTALPSTVTTLVQLRSLERQAAAAHAEAAVSASRSLAPLLASLAASSSSAVAAL